MYLIVLPNHLLIAKLFRNLLKNCCDFLAHFFPEDWQLIGSAYGLRSKIVHMYIIVEICLNVNIMHAKDLNVRVCHMSTGKKV